MSDTRIKYNERGWYVVRDAGKFDACVLGINGVWGLYPDKYFRFRKEAKYALIRAEAEPEASSTTPFEPGHEYTTRDGRRARVYAVDGVGVYKIHGATQEKDGDWYIHRWTIDGHVGYNAPSHANDLLPPPPPTKTWWVNLYQWNSDNTIMTARKFATQADAKFDAAECLEHSQLVAVGVPVELPA